MLSRRRSAYFHTIFPSNGAFHNNKTPISIALWPQMISQFDMRHDIFPGTIEERRDALEQYLQRLIHSDERVTSSPAFIKFLDVDKHVCRSPHRVVLLYHVPCRISSTSFASSATSSLQKVAACASRLERFDFHPSGEFVLRAKKPLKLTPTQCRCIRCHSISCLLL